jgi:hypothetical protein
MVTTKRDRFLVIRLSDQLRRVLEEEASADGRPLSAFARRVLIDFAEKRFAARQAA